MKASVWIYARWNRYGKNYDYQVFNTDNMGEYGYILLEEQEVTFSSPNDKVLQQLAVKALKQKQAAILGKAHAEANEIEGEISELLAIEDKSAAEVDDDLPF